MGDFQHYLNLIGNRDHEGIESARDMVDANDVTLLIDHYDRLAPDDWESKACVIYLVQDQAGSREQLAHIMLDFLRAPPGPDDTIDLAQAIALCLLEGDFDLFMKYYDDRELLRTDVARMLKAKS